MFFKENVQGKQNYQSLCTYLTPNTITCQNHKIYKKYIKLQKSAHKCYYISAIFIAPLIFDKKVPSRRRSASIRIICIRTIKKAFASFKRHIQTGNSIQFRPFYSLRWIILMLIIHEIAKCFKRFFLRLYLLVIFSLRFLCFINVSEAISHVTD